MLELKNIRKTYEIGDIQTKALDDISLSFREKEFVAILGTSGSGKTTSLNIIGGLDRYDSGDLIIKGRSTKDFKDSDWDAYRNNTIGFVFQSYNLINHLSIVDNVELGMTLSGVSPSEKRKKALDALEKVGLKDHLHKKPNQLSGGQMQRVAIARALANDPEILLCDEPTGALDTITSIQIMDLIKEVAKDRLVIMVTHNPELAESYADRIIEFKDGKIINDTNSYVGKDNEDNFKLKKTSMGFATALHLSFNNIKTKKGRTFLTAFASSIGIIGIAIILSLSSGFQAQIDNFQQEAMAEFPITITKSAMTIDAESIGKKHNEFTEKFKDIEEYGEYNEVYPYDPSETTLIHTNNISEDYLSYLKDIDPNICENIGYTRIVNMNLLRNIDGKVEPVTISSGISGMSSNSNITSMSGIGLSSYPTTLNEKSVSYLEKNYDLLAGNYPDSEEGLVLVVDSKNRIDVNTLEKLGFQVKDIESINFEELIGTEFKLIDNDSYYNSTPMGTFIPSSDYDAMYEADGGITLKIQGIVRQRKDVKLGVLAPGIAYSDDLSQRIIDLAMDSEIVKSQKEVTYNVMTREEIDEDTKNQMLSYLGGNETPYMITIYPTSFDDKDAVTKYLDEYNQGMENVDDKVVYSDLAATMTELTSGIMNGITMVLVAFAAISLVVSLIMICIITYTSVLERTKEIGILKALGARKKDITRVFNAETFILGVFSGTLGVVIAWLCTFPINSIIYKVTELEQVAHLQLVHAITLVVISTVLTVIGGHIPAKMASKKDAVEALRSE